MPAYPTQKKSCSHNKEERDFDEEAREITSLLDPLFVAKSREGLRQKKKENK